MSRLDWRFHGMLSKFIRSGVISGKKGEVVYVPATKQGKHYHIFVLGGGITNKSGTRTGNSPKIEQLIPNIKAVGAEHFILSKSDFGDLQDAEINQSLMDAIVDCDEKLMERYLEGETFTDDEIFHAIEHAMAAGTLSLPGIVEAWAPWWLLWQLPGAVIFFVAGLAELQRPPFDMPVADSEIIFGAYTEYTGLRFALFLLAEYAGIVVLCALTTVLFLGGWQGPFATELGGAPGVVWTLTKTFALAFVVIWLRVSYPRLREDQLQRLAWQGLVPVALAQLALTGVVAVAT